MIKRHIVMALLVSALVLISSCSLVYINPGSESDDRAPVYEQISSTGSPAQSPGSKRVYRYYLSNSVYYDVERGLYFYLRDGRWTKSRAIPAVLGVNISSFVTLEMDTDKPYLHHDEVLNIISESD